MKRFKTGEYKSALLKKGFKPVRQTTDEMFYFYVGGEKTQIHTKVSFGPSKDIRDPLMRMIKTQLCLNNKEIEQFIECPMEYEKYKETLRERGKL